MLTTIVLCGGEQMRLDKGPKDTRAAEDLKFAKRHVANAEAGHEKNEAYKRGWR